MMSIKHVVKNKKMKLSEFKQQLVGMSTVSFQLPNGNLVPPHFHITEVGHTQRKFIDCGGKIRMENRINFQLWEADDFYHRLKTEKLIEIIDLAQKVLNLADDEIEMEYQGATIGKYTLAWNGLGFELRSTKTACLAEDQCGIPSQKDKREQVNLAPTKESICTPGGKCC